MQVRGSVIKSIDQFVLDNYRGKHADWKAKLPSESQNLIDKVSTSNWYPIIEGVINPTQVMCDMFFNTNKEGAWESGKYSAEMALTGVYKIFVLVSSPTFLMKRATRVLSTFYEPAEIKVTGSTNNSMVLQCAQLPVNNELVEYRIAGWMEKALEICGCKNLRVNITKSLAKGQDRFEVTINWS